MSIVGHYIAQTLKNFGISRIYGVAGESFLPILDGCYEFGIDFIATRHEGGAAIMAASEGKLTNRPGIVMVSRGPGAMNGALGVHTADEESAPLIYIIGQAESHLRYKGAFQEMEFTQIFAPFSKMTFELQRAEDVVGLLEEAWLAALSDCPGPVVISLPEDILYHDIDCKPSPQPPQIYSAIAQPDMMADIYNTLQQAQKPLVIIGGSGWINDGIQAIQSFAHLWNIPVLTGFRRFDYFNNYHRCYAGRMGLGQAKHIPNVIQESDVIITIGCPLSDIDTYGGDNFKKQSPNSKHFHIINHRRNATRLADISVSVISDYNQFAHALSMMPYPFSDENHAIWQEWCDDCHEKYNQFSSPQDDNHQHLYAQTIHFLQNILPQGTITTAGAGNYNYLLQRYWKYSHFNSFCGAINGTMGYSIPAAIAAALNYPMRNVVCFAGDGCAMMTINELSTIAAYQLPILIVIVNNNMLGTIDMHQQKSFENRSIGIAQHNPNFVTLAQSFNIESYKVSHIDDLKQATKDIIKKSVIEKPLLLELVLDGDNLSPTKFQ